MYLTILASFLAAHSILAFPFVAETPGVDSSLFRKANRVSRGKRQSSCPFNQDHPGAAPYNANYPYTGAQNALPGTGKGGILVPAPGDTAHAFEAPGPNDIRGPCPGLNTAANHHVSFSITSKSVMLTLVSLVPKPRRYHQLHRACRCPTKFIQCQLRPRRRFSHSWHRSRRRRTHRKAFSWLRCH